MKKKIFLSFGLGALVGAGIMYLFKEKQLEELREIFDYEEEFEDDEDFFDEGIARDFDENYDEGCNSKAAKDDEKDVNKAENMEPEAEIAKD